MSDTAILNMQWAHILIQQLIDHGIDYFCIAPGSRSTPLALAIAANLKARKCIHFDERGLGFHALGYGKATKKAAALVVTSGTAVGNLLPAVMEAANDRIPMILLTADRPAELRDSGANQTCDQIKLFGDYVRWHVDLPAPTEAVSERFLVSTIAQAVTLSHFAPAGPVQLNCQFREPLFSHVAIEDHKRLSVTVDQPMLMPTKEAIERFANTLSQSSNGIIIGGASNEVSCALAEKLQWPLFADILSPLRNSSSDALITHFEAIVKVMGDLKVDTVLHIGDRITSKPLIQWLLKHPPLHYLHLTDHPVRHDPEHLVTHRLIGSLPLTTAALLPHLPQKWDWLPSWQEWDKLCKERFETLFSELTEPGALRALAPCLNEGYALFLGNGMPIRDANQFLSLSRTCGPVFGNRGVSGIDGNIATATGIAQGLNQPIIAVIGDQAALYDLNSIALLKMSRVLLVIINNGGGGIFSFLPIAEKKEIFEEYYAAAHDYTFKSAAELFGIPYFCPKTCEELQEHLRASDSAIIEVQTNRQENVLFHKHLDNEIKACLTASLV